MNYVDRAVMAMQQLNATGHPTWRLPPEARFGGRILPTGPGGPIAGQVNADAVLIDSIAGLGFKPRALYLSCQFPNPRWIDTREVNIVLPGIGGNIRGGLVVLEFRGLNPGGEYLRRFSLPVHRSIRIPVESFKDIKVVAVDQTGDGYALVATVTDEVQESSPNEPLYLATRDSPGVGGGTFTVPPGAVSLIGSVSDPAFEWADQVEAQISIGIPAPLFAGVPIDVRATQYQTSLALLDIIWRINL